MMSHESKSDGVRRRLARTALSALAVGGALSCGGCMMMIPNDVVHRVSVDARAHPKDLRACVVEAIRGVDGVPGVNPPVGGDEQSLVAFRTVLPEVSGEVERQGDDGVRVSIETVAHREPANFWQFAQLRAQVIADAIAARCGAL
jgi:hypothetical protein